MKQFTVFESSSGRILRTGTCQDETFDAQAMNSGEGILEGSGAWATQYVVSGELQSRQASTVALSKSGNTITLTGVNAGIQPQVISASAVTSLDASDGSPIITTLASGAYLVTVDQFPEMQFSQQITIP